MAELVRRYNVHTDLLAACKRYINAIEDDGEENPHPYMGGVNAEIRAAIAKAKERTR